MYHLKYDYQKEGKGNRFKFNFRPFLAKFSFHPCAFCSLVNIISLLGLACIAYGLYMIFNMYSYKQYGDHCTVDWHCKPDMNYVCSNGVCTCTTNTYFVQLSDPCGKISILLYLLIRISFNYCLINLFSKSND